MTSFRPGRIIPVDRRLDHTQPTSASGAFSVRFGFSLQTGVLNHSGDARMAQEWITDQFCPIRVVSVKIGVYAIEMVKDYPRRASVVQSDVQN
jgi:hypothetical protein